MDLKASKLSQLGHFLFHCPFKGGYFSSVNLEMVVRVRLREVSAYGRLEMWSFGREIVGTAVWCPLNYGRCPLTGDVPVSGGSTVLLYIFFWHFSGTHVRTGVQTATPLVR